MISHSMNIPTSFPVYVVATARLYHHSSSFLNANSNASVNVQARYITISVFVREIIGLQSTIPQGSFWYAELFGRWMAPSPLSYGC